MKSNPEGQGGSKAMKSPRLPVPFQLVSGTHRLGIGREKDMEDGASSPLSPCRSRLAVTFGGTALPGLSLLFSSKSPPSSQVSFPGSGEDRGHPSSQPRSGRSTPSQPDSTGSPELLLINATIKPQVREPSISHQSRHFNFPA